MIILQKILNPADASFNFMLQLLEETFPPQERRPVSDLAKLVSCRKDFHCNIIAVSGSPAGLLNWWQFEDFNYLEHFALAPNVRNKRLGTAVLEKFLMSGPILLEVEAPDSVLNMRRIAFYKRNNLRLWDNITYLQPPYAPEYEPVPMLLMASPEIPSEDAENIISKLHKKVYGVAD